MRASISRLSHFSAAHRLANAHWSEAKNQKVFGKCANPNFHGHNYDLVVTVTGKIDPETGFVVDLKQLDRLITKDVIERFDHKNLNLDTTEFKTRIPTTENIALVIWHILRPKIFAGHELKVIVYETKRNFCEYRGE